MHLIDGISKNRDDHPGNFTDQMNSGITQIHSIALNRDIRNSEPVLVFPYLFFFSAT